MQPDITEIWNHVYSYTRVNIKLNIFTLKPYIPIFIIPNTTHPTGGVQGGFSPQRGVLRGGQSHPPSKIFSIFGSHASHFMAFETNFTFYLTVHAKDVNFKVWDG